MAPAAVMPCDPTRYAANGVGVDGDGCVNRRGHPVLERVLSPALILTVRPAASGYAGMEPGSDWDFAIERMPSSSRSARAVRGYVSMVVAICSCGNCTAS